MKSQFIKNHMNWWLDHQFRWIGNHHAGFLVTPHQGPRALETAAIPIVLELKPYHWNVADDISKLQMCRKPNY